LGAYYSPSCA
jgi:hypothetical protein